MGSPSIGIVLREYTDWELQLGALEHDSERLLRPRGKREARTPPREIRGSSENNCGASSECKYELASEHRHYSLKIL